MNFFFIFTFFVIFYFELLGNNFCKVENILDSNKRIICNDKQTIFAYLNFFSDKPNLSYTKLDDYKLVVSKIYASQIKKFIKEYCHFNYNLRVKEIINPTEFYPAKFSVKMIISCDYKVK